MSVPKVAAVIGAGTMGPGMAAVLARAGSQVRLYDISDEILERAKGSCQMAAGALDRVEAASAPGGSVAFSSDLGTALAGAGLVLEAIPERLDLKREVTARLEDHLADDAIIASNTSGIPITQIATALRHPARFAGMHWSNPPHLIPMIEVVPGEQTAAATTDKIVEIIESFGYEAVTEKEVPGFVENRIHRPGSVGQASRRLADLGDDGAAYCGGTELLLAMKLGLASYEHLVDLKRVDGLRGIEAAAGGGVRIGAATTHHEIETSAELRARYPEMPAMISQVANLRVRSVGTLGGNLCFADPHSDPASFLTAVGATLICQRGEATRRVPAGQFLAGPYQTVPDPGELLPGGEASPDYLRHLVAVHARRALREAFAAASTAA